MSDRDELRTRIAREREAIPVPSDPGMDDVARRAGRMRNRRRVVAGVVGVAVGIGVVAPLGWLWSIEEKGSGARIGALARGSNPIPDLARVACDGETTTVLTPTVRPQADGLHIQVNNSSGGLLGIEVSQGRGDNAPQGLSETVWPIAPGKFGVRCFSSELASTWQPLELLDPAGLFTPDSVQCPPGDPTATGFIDYTIDQGEHGTPVEIARRFFASKLRTTDLVQRAGYPAAAEPTVVVIREGRILATAHFFPGSDGTWRLHQNSTCSSF